MSGLLRLPLPLVAAPAAMDDTVSRAAAVDTSRIAALDGLRGVLAMMVVASHYFGEVPHGVPATMVAWIAIRMFFVLSGFLMARIIVENLSSPNFFTTFYVRRLCRTMPVYLVLLAIVFGAAHLFHSAPWMDADRVMPLWSFLTFTQGLVMVARADAGTEWLTPTWTLTVEEQFYLIAPLICLLAPRRHLLAVLAGFVVASLVYRGIVLETRAAPRLAAMVLLPGAMHAMFLGMIAALLLNSPRIDWPRLDLAVRLAPIACLSVVLGLKLADGKGDRLFELIGVPLVSLGCMFFLIAIVRGAPEANRFGSKPLKVLGRLSYSIYLLHVPVLGLMHGLILGAKQDIATLPQIAVTVAAVPVAIGLAWLVNRYIEQPMIDYGRSWRFDKPARATT